MTHFVFTMIGATLFTSLAFASEPLPFAPREAEVLKVMPRITTASDADPIWIQRGAVRSEGTYETPLPAGKFEINQRQLKFLRALDKLQLFEPEDDLDYRGWEWDILRSRIIGPERLLVEPRVVK